MNARVIWRSALGANPTGNGTCPTMENGLLACTIAMFEIDAASVPVFFTSRTTCADWLIAAGLKTMLDSQCRDGDRCPRRRENTTRSQPGTS